jgi:hypothetical protein
METPTLLASAALAASLLAATTAGAEVLDFSWAGSGTFSGKSASWIQPSDPTPASYNADLGNTEIAVTNGTATFGPISTVIFYTGGGFVAEGGLDALGLTGPQLFTGTVAAPIFSTGVYTLGSGALTVTAVPESSTWAMMVAGLAGLGALYRRCATVAA